MLAPDMRLWSPVILVIIVERVGAPYDKNSPPERVFESFQMGLPVSEEGIYLAYLNLLTICAK